MTDALPANGVSGSQHLMMSDDTIVEVGVRKGKRLPPALLLAIAWSCGGAQGFRELTVGGTDYAFMVPDTLDAGLVAVTFDNTGSVAHELGIVLLMPGVTLTDVALPDSLALPEDSLYAEEGAVLLARAGERVAQRLLTRFESGRDYLLWCDFRDAPDAPRHSELGMIKVIHVR